MPDATLRSNAALNSKQVKTSPMGAFVMDATVEVGAAATANTQYVMMRLPMAARIHGFSRVYFDDLASTGSPTLDFGLKAVGGNFATDVDALNDGVDVATAASNAALIKDIANYGKMVWEFAGLSANPGGGFADLIITILDAATNTGGTVTATVAYTVD